MLNLADMPIVDDLDVPVSAEEYVDQANPIPPKPGNYRLVVTDGEMQKNQDGTLFLTDGKWPVFVIKKAKIVEPTESEREIFLFQNVRYKLFPRKNSVGAEVPASDLYDLLWGYDGSGTIEDGQHANQLLAQHVQQGDSFIANLKWTAYDKDYVEAEFGKIGGKDKAAKDVANAIYAKARKSTKDFYVGSNLNPTCIGPSGAVLEARLAIARYYRSTVEVGAGKDQITLGPSVKKPKK